MDYLELMRGAGLGDVLIPKKEFIREHERLVKLLNQSDLPALRKEAKDQQAELAKEGGSNKSNFIARMMAEDKYKHALPEDRRPRPYRQGRKNGRPTANPTKGVYRKPVMDPEEDDTDMRAPIKFNYNKLAHPRQDPDAENKRKYGASPFIAHHFGNAASDAIAREDAVQKRARKFFGKKDEEDEDDDEEEEDVPPRAPRAPRVRDENAAKRKREDAREEFKQRKQTRERMRDDVRLPESIKRAERKRKQLAAMSPEERERRKIADKERKERRGERRR
jgi:hypothetical protein